MDLELLVGKDPTIICNLKLAVRSSSLGVYNYVGVSPM